MARKIFGDSIPYEKVKIYNEKWKSAQSDGTVVTPNGNIYYPPKHKRYAEDYSSLPPNSTDSLLKLHTFMHEMVHIWQKYVGGTATVIIGGISSTVGAGYKYTLDVNKRLSDYGLEAQANIISDYYFQLAAKGAYCSQAWGCPSIGDYEKVLKNFLANPRDRKNLPKPSTDPLAGYR